MGIGEGGKVSTSAIGGNNGDFIGEVTNGEYLSIGRSGKSSRTDYMDGNYNANTVYEGSYFEFIPNEINLLRPLYNFNPAIDSVSLQQDDLSLINTHSPWNTNANNTGFSDVDYWDRKLDYLFTITRK